MKHCVYLLSLFILSCQAPLSLIPEEVNSIQYDFYDSSVPPEYHRSYTIVVLPNEIQITVDSYGDILADKTYPLDDDAFNALIQTINDAKLSAVDVRSESCDGGTAEALTITEQNQPVYISHIDHCGGTKIPASAGDYASVVKAIEALIPDLANLLE